MSVRSSMSAMSSEVTVNLAVLEAYSPLEAILRDLIVLIVVLAPWATAGKKPCTMFVKTRSCKVFVAFKNWISRQFSKEERFASTWPYQKRVRGLSGEVVAATLCKMIESKSFSFAAGMFAVVVARV